MLAREEFGRGSETLICVHGLGGSSNSWYPQAQVLTRDFRIIAYDLAGAGRSRVPDRISIESHVEDLSALMRELGVANAHLAGHSMGTIVCQHMAASRPEAVASLALVGALQQPPEGARKALKDRAVKARSEGMRGIADAIVAGGTSQETRVNQPAAAAFVRESLMAQPPEGYALNCEALSEARAADLSRVRCPVLLVTGDQDKTAPVDVARAIQSGLNDAELVVQPGCGHWATIERAKQVSYAMTKFYAMLRQPQRAQA